MSLFAPATWLGPTPSPASSAAREAGCTCPSVDNDDGQGLRSLHGLLWTVDADCPVHRDAHRHSMGDGPKSSLRPAHDPETGEITESAAGAVRPSTPSATPRQVAPAAGTMQASPPATEVVDIEKAPETQGDSVAALEQPNELTPPGRRGGQ